MSIVTHTARATATVFGTIAKKNSVAISMGSTTFLQGLIIKTANEIRTVRSRISEKVTAKSFKRVFDFGKLSPDKILD